MPLGTADLAQLVGAVSIVGGGVVWLLREKLGTWVKRQTASRFTMVEDRLKAVEAEQASHKGEMMRIAESMERSSEQIGEAVRRLTTAVERIVEAHEEMTAKQHETAQVVARVDERTKMMQSHIELRQAPR